MQMKLRYKLLIVLVLGTLAFGVSGWMDALDACKDLRHETLPVYCPVAASDSELWPDAVYLTLLAFSLEDVYSPPANFAVNVARFLGAASVVTGILEVIILVFSEQWGWLWIRVRKPDIVLAGIQPMTAALAEYMAGKEGKTVTIVATAKELQTVEGRLGGRRIHIMRSDPTNPKVLKSAGVLKASQVLAGSGDDFTNLAIAKTVLALGSSTNKPETFVHLRAQNLAASIDLMDDTYIGLRTLTESALVARAGVLVADLSVRAEKRAQERVHAVIVGCGERGIALIEYIGLTCWYKDYEKPRITVLDCDPDIAKTCLQSRLPGALKAMNVQVHGLDALTFDVDESNALYDAEESEPITTIFIAIGDDRANSTVALRIRSIQERQQRALASIFVHIRSSANPWNRAPLTSGAPDNNEQDRIDLGIEAFGDEETIARLSPILDEFVENTARDLHADYLKIPARSDAASVEWEGLAEGYRRASRRAAAHVQSKLLSIGMVPPDFAVDPTHHPFVHQSQHAALKVDSGAIAGLAALEHRRWIAERRLEGWRYGKIRDPQKRQHPAMLPNADLPEAEAQKDTAQIDTIFSIVSEPGKTAAQSWRRLLNIGVFGPLSLDDAAVDHVQAAILNKIAPAIWEKYADRAVSIVTPGAPGADLEIPLSLLKSYLSRGENLPKPRLMVAAAAPWPALVKCHPDVRDAKTIATGKVDDAAQKTLDLVTGAMNATHARLYNYRENDDLVWEEFSMTPPGVSMVDFLNDKRLRNQLFVRSAAYIVERADVIVMVSGLNGTVYPGGSRETLACLMGERPIPAAASSLPKGQQHSGRFEGRQVFIIDPKTGKVEQKFSGKLMWEA